MVTGFMRSMLLATAFVCGLAQSACPIEAPLTYQPFPEDLTEGFFPLLGYASQTVSTTPPDGNWKLPESVSRPLYCLITLGDMKRLAVLDRQSATDVFFTRICFDKNGNGDLTDDPSLDGSLNTNAGDDFCLVQFPWVDITVDVNGKPLPYRFQPTLLTPSLKSFSEALRGPRLDPEEIKDLVQLTVSIRCAYVGAFATDKGLQPLVSAPPRTYHVALGDRNGNTRFDDRIAQAGPFPSKDRRGSPEAASCRPAADLRAAIRNRSTTRAMPCLSRSRKISRTLTRLPRRWLPNVQPPTWAICCCWRTSSTRFPWILQAGV